MIDRKHIGHVMPKAELTIEEGRLRFFARATGQTHPVYIDTKAAREAGYRDLPAAPSFMFAAELDAHTITELLDHLGVDLKRVLHGEQEFAYFAPVCAGDVITVESRVSDIYDKKNGALEFVVKDSTITNQLGIKVAEMRSVIVVRN